ncbi:hypothetical protein [Novosphingobium sp. CCH12-A3]|uniref:hypothetical protein n=1 Tax=Novosphingobium sp. CCH12-A3 TaxID=1768752 RepID=UPI0007862F6E|nr:hypothetical protein [Novosphingobium sp. CCH12-A3]
MLSAPLLKLGGRLWALLLALTVLTHALVPFEAPVTVRHGSAFSAATVDMAVAPRKVVQIQRAVVPMAPPPPVVLAPRLAPVPLVQHEGFWPPQTAPPAPQPLALLPAPRAPPPS